MNMGSAQRHFLHHRLNGNSSSVLTATSLSYGKSKNSTPHRIKTPDPIKIKFGTIDYVGEGTRHAKFYANPPRGASQQMGEIYAKIFIAIHIPFFQKLTYRSDPSADFCARWLKLLMCAACGCSCCFTVSQFLANSTSYTWF